LIRVLVSARSAITRAGLETLVRADARFEVVGQGYRDGDLGRLLREHSPDVVLQEGGDTVGSQLPIYLHEPGAPMFVLLVPNLTRADLRRNLQSGIRAILLRDSAPHEIIAALDSAAAGLAVISPELLDTLLPALADTPDPDDLPSGEPLTARESEVLALLAEGVGNKEIASRLHISEHTVKFHVSSILAKLGAATRTEAVTRGYKEGLIVM
jgi:two-component system, NarL family, response regulator YdfI